MEPMPLERSMLRDRLLTGLQGRSKEPSQDQLGHMWSLDLDLWPRAGERQRQKE